MESLRVPKKVFRVVLVSLLALAVAFGAIITTQSTQVHAASAKTFAQQSTQNSSPSSEPAWIVKAGPYVHVSNGIAVIDPAIRKALSPNDVVLVTQAVQKYNALPYAAKVKKAPATGVSSHRFALPNDYCPSGSAGYTGPYVYWWGYAYTLNHCFILQLWTAVYVDGGTAAAGAICAALSAGACVAVEALTVAYIASTVKALNDADTQCNKQGANLNFTTGVPVPWVNAVC
jgi:hypothetical protein